MNLVKGTGKYRFDPAIAASPPTPAVIFGTIFLHEMRKNGTNIVRPPSPWTPFFFLFVISSEPEGLREPEAGGGRNELIAYM